MLARQLVERPELLVLAEPTQGVDVGAKEEIHRIITELADDGTAVLVVTSDLPEAMRISDRLQVVRNGTTTVEFGPDATQVDVLAAAAGDVEQAIVERVGGGRMSMTSTSAVRDPASIAAASEGRVTGFCAPPVTGQELVLIGVIAVLWVLLAFATPAFMTAGSIQPLLVRWPRSR